MKPDRHKLLYRKVNTRTYRVRHHKGPDYRHTRNTRDEVGSDRRRGKMVQGRRRGLDYTPLFKFLLSKVGQDWDAVHSAAVPRLDRPEPIFWLVALHPEDRRPAVLVGESSYYSGLFVDDDNVLRKVDPELGPESMEPSCACCTHTFNGVVFAKKYRPPELPADWDQR